MKAAGEKRHASIYGLETVKPLDVLPNKIKDPQEVESSPESLEKRVAGERKVLSRYNEALAGIYENQSSIPQEVQDLEGLVKRIAQSRDVEQARILTVEFAQKSNDLVYIANTHIPSVESFAQTAGSGLPAFQDFVRRLQRAAEFLRLGLEKGEISNKYQVASERLNVICAEALVWQSGYESFKAMQTRDRELEERQRQLKEQLRGAGRITNFSEINRLAAELKAISRIRKQFYKQRYNLSPMYSYFRDEDLFTRAQEIVILALNQLDRHLEGLLDEAESPAKSEVERLNRELEKVLPQAVEDLSRGFIEKHVFPKLKDGIYREKGQDEDFDFNAEAARAKGLLAEAARISVNPSFYSSEQEKEAAKQFIEQLPRYARDAVQQEMPNPYSTQPGNQSFWEMARFVAEQPRSRAAMEAYGLVRDSVSKAEGTFKGRSSFGYTKDQEVLNRFREIKKTLGEHHPALRFFYTTGQAYQTIQYLDVRRWGVFKDNPQIQEMFGPKLLDSADLALAEDALEKTVTSEGSYNQQGYAERLMHFKRAEVVPMVVMNAVRVREQRGQKNLNLLRNYGTRKSALGEYINSLDQSVLEKLEQENLPGLSEIIAAIKSDPDSFENIYEYVNTTRDNKFYEGVVKLVNYFLQQQDLNSQLMALEAIQSFPSNLPVDLTELYRTMDRLAGECKEKRVADTFFQTAKELLSKGQTKCAEIYLQHQGHWERQFGQQARANLEVVIVQYLSQKLPEPEVLKNMAEAWQTTPEQLTQVYNFLAELEKNKVQYNKRAFLNDYLKLAADPAVLPAILELRQYGYVFDASHASLMGEIVTAKEDIKTTVVTYRPYGYNFDLSHLPILKELIEKKQQICEAMDNIRRIGPSFNFMPQRKEGGFEVDPYNLVKSHYPRIFNSDIFNVLGGKLSDNPQNWPQQLTAYIAMEEELANNLPSNTRIYLKDAFSPQNPANREMCLNGLRDYYKTVLIHHGQCRLPIEGEVLLAAIEQAEGAGNLKYIELLGRFLYELRKQLEDVQLSEQLKAELSSRLLAQEERFKKERWSEEDRSQFYTISREVLHITPLLYRETLDILSKLGPKEMLRFNRDLMPLYQARLVLMRSSNQEKEQYDTQSLLALQRQLSELAASLEGMKDSNQRQEHISQLQVEQVGMIQDGFKQKFGLLKIPESWDDEKMRFVQNFVRYFGNIAMRDSAKENLIALYLGLNINGKWEEFRVGKAVDLQEYFQGERLLAVQEYVEKRKEADALTPDNLGIEAADLSEFQKLLQEETLAQLLGTVQTIDEKLGSLARGLTDLGDEDAYPNEKDKRLLALCKQHGKQVGAALAASFRKLTGKAGELSLEQAEIFEELQKIYGSNFTAERIKAIQDEIKPISLVANTIQAIKDKQVYEQISELKLKLVPSDEIVEIFNRLGENFRPGSGALALSQDLSYLENIIVKDAEKMSEEERETLNRYLGDIRGQMQKLERAYLEFSSQVDKIRQSAHGRDNQLLQDRLAEISRMLNRQEEATEILSRMTSNFNFIIENMRQCLGCLRKESNNDTNLAFGDNNKFYLMSQTPDSRSSVADEIVYLLPAKEAGEQQEMSFVMDQVYGAKSGDILSVNAMAVIKKMQQIKNRFPQAKLSVIVTQEAMRSGGLDAELFKSRLEKAGVINADFHSAEKVEVLVPKSAAGDNYIEFGYRDAEDPNAGPVHARSTGKRMVNGLIIR